MLKRKHPKTNVALFRSWSEPMAYVLGFVLADGCVLSNYRTVNGRKYRDYKVRLKQAGAGVPEFFQAIQSFAGGAINGPYTPKGFKAKPQWLLTWCSKELVELLSSYGIGSKKSLECTLPDVPSEFSADLFRGIFDGDGDFCPASRKNNCTMGVTSGSSSCTEGLRDLIHRETGLLASITSYRRSYPKSDGAGQYYSVRWSTRKTRELASWMYSGKDLSIWLPRKFDQWEQQRKLLESV